ncbi:MAG: DUF192 domain-containing protein, partial [Actinomycetota bacterium]|nr:DUF192 domain-containing protein [Actinomycetota bacterium]
MRHGTLRHQDGREWQVEIPDDRRERRRGLLGRPFLEPRRAMLFEECRSVHTFGMRLPITVVLLDGDLRVAEVRRLPPGRILLPRHHVRHVMECAEGAEIAIGDTLEFVLRADDGQEDAAENPREEDADDGRRHEQERDRPADRAR